MTAHQKGPSDWLWFYHVCSILLIWKYIIIIIIPKTPVNCVGQLVDCSASTSNYFSPESAICPSCVVKLEEFLKLASHPPSQCPCCHEPNSGDPFSLSPSCEKETQTDGMLDSPWGTRYLDRDKNKMICV
jgi:hypothetical protein